MICKASWCYISELSLFLALGNNYIDPSEEQALNSIVMICKVSLPNMSSLISHNVLQVLLANNYPQGEAFISKPSLDWFKATDIEFPVYKKLLSLKWKLLLKLRIHEAVSVYAGWYMW